MKLRTVALIGGVLCGLLVVGIALAEGGLDLGWFLIGGSGQRVEGGNLSLDSSIGQSVNEPVQGGGLELQPGFLVGAEMATPTPTITPGGPTFTPTMTATPTNTPTITPTPKPVPDLHLPLLYKNT